MSQNNPLAFVDTVKVGKHVVLFYEELEYARMLEFRFLGNGLVKGERAIYVSNDDAAFIENEMQDSGIDVMGFNKNGMLRTVNITDSLKDGDGTTDAQKLWNKITEGVQPPFRMVAKINSVGTVDGILAKLEVERYWHKTFDTLGCALLCPYDVSEIEDIRRGKWIAELLRTHHGAIFAPRVGKGIGYYDGRF